MKPYFSKFPTILTKQGDEQKYATNILMRTRIRELVLNTTSSIYQWEIKDGESPEIVASKYYGSPYYNWAVMQANNIFDVQTQWPKSANDLDDLMDRLYSTPTKRGLDWATQNLHHYENSYGDIIQEKDFLATPYSERRIVTVYDWHIAENEKKRKIKLVSKKYITQLDRELDTLLKKDILT